MDKAGAEVARTRARSGLAPLIHTACDQLESVLKGLFDLARKRMHKKDSECKSLFIFYILELIVFTLFTLLPFSS